MATSEAETSTAPVLLKECDIPEASLAEGSQQTWEKLLFCFGSHVSVIVKAQLVRRRYVYIE